MNATGSSKKKRRIIDDNNDIKDDQISMDMKMIDLMRMKKKYYSGNPRKSCLDLMIQTIYSTVLFLEIENRQSIHAVLRQEN